MHFRTVKETRKLRGFSDLFMVNRRLIIIIIILIIGKGFLLLFIYYYLFYYYYYYYYFVFILGAVIKRDTKFLTRYVKGVPLVNRMETKEVPCLSKIYSETSIKWTLIKRIPSIKRTLSWVPKLTSYISLYNEPLFRGHLY